jgi:hypothetical protein
VRAAIAPSYPQYLSALERRALRALGGRLGARPWEAHVIVRPNFHASAIIWHNVMR